MIRCGQQSCSVSISIQLWWIDENLKEKSLFSNTHILWVRRVNTALNFSCNLDRFTEFLLTFLTRSHDLASIFSNSLWPWCLFNYYFYRCCWYHLVSMDNPHYESILKLLKELHKVPSTSSRPQTTQSEDDLSSVGNGRNSRSSTSQSLALQIDNPSPQRKKSIFDFRIPILTVTGSPYSSPDTADAADNRKFSFSHFRRHSNVLYKVLLLIKLRESSSD